MDIIDAILAYVQKSETETAQTAPEGTCPVCWGRQQYDGKIRTILKDKQIDVNNHKDSYMIIEEFVKTYINGIKLKEDEVKNCITCGFKNNVE